MSLKYDESRAIKPKGYCQECGKLQWISKKACICLENNKFIVREYPPYDKKNPTCSNFIKHESE